MIAHILQTVTAKRELISTLVDNLMQSVSKAGIFQQHSDWTQDINYSMIKDPPERCLCILCMVLVCFIPVYADVIAFNYWEASDNARWLHLFF